jgi:hypothetical protein
MALDLQDLLTVLPEGEICFTGTSKIKDHIPKQTNCNMSVLGLIKAGMYVCCRPSKETRRADCPKDALISNFGRGFGKSSID